MCLLSVPTMAPVSHDSWACGDGFGKGLGSGIPSVHSYACSHAAPPHRPGSPPAALRWRPPQLSSFSLGWSTAPTMPGGAPRDVPELDPSLTQTHPCRREAQKDCGIPGKPSTMQGPTTEAESQPQGPSLADRSRRRSAHQLRGSGSGAKGRPGQRTCLALGMRTCNTGTVPLCPRSPRRRCF